ncbi:TetR/AcrR family transcriptional regulator [Viridibacillus sp. NPDC096237]|uniref:TetR/AcrR family transcriptional regulator n=1 Tax=Viridibacillus sp. NPDC096237 TaxID=3390721 RepID=UPI003D07D566
MARERKFSSDEIFNTTKILLLKYGYEGYTFSLLADALNVSRAAIYKYYLNKEELIFDYLVSALKKIHIDLKLINQQEPFTEQLDELVSKLYKYKDLQQILLKSKEIQENGSEVLIHKKELIQHLQLGMYTIIQTIIEQGKKEHFLDKEMPNDTILMFILHSVATPNSNGIAQELWFFYIKKLICCGISGKKAIVDV